MTSVRSSATWKTAGFAISLSALAATPVALAQEANTYRYDALGRLTATTRAEPNTSGAYAGYSYDPADNRGGVVRANTPVRAVANELRSGESLVPQQKVTSLDGRIAFVLQDDGNLVVTLNQFTALWGSGTSTGKAMVLRMQTDGNLVLVNPAEQTLWSSGTGGNPGARLIVQNDGNVAIYNGATPIWATNTCCV